ncbi:hypothetical protein DY000_02015027 [Brassica cretica]|uniref:Uncharacterized protein n=1 Tax=Brassica cretica TaxID=69181 RepID=A0ABQ7D1U5_BRACR|nr:hypothetical protein DY000_02015027 [Brassica cretica]
MSQRKLKIDMQFNQATYKEDIPEEFAKLVVNFISRNGIRAHVVEIPGNGSLHSPRFVSVITMPWSFTCFACQLMN